MRDPTAPYADPSRRDAAVAKDRLDDWLDRALEDTFPASDPVASPPRGAAPLIENLGGRTARAPVRESKSSRRSRG